MSRWSVKLPLLSYTLSCHVLRRLADELTNLELILKISFQLYFTLLFIVGYLQKPKKHSSLYKLKNSQA